MAVGPKEGPREHKEPMPPCLHVLVRNKSKINYYYFFCLLLAPPKNWFHSSVPSLLLSLLELSLLLSKQLSVKKTFLGSTQGTQAVAQLGTFTVMAAHGWESSKERWLQPG